jgi:hypothetical protein
MEKRQVKREVELSYLKKVTESVEIKNRKLHQR